MVYELFFKTQFVEYNTKFIGRFMDFAFSPPEATLLSWPTAEELNEAVDRGKGIVLFTARAKVSLLVASKPISVGASPFFHRLHVFRKRLRDAYRCFLHSLRLSFFRLHCPQLRKLSLEVEFCVDSGAAVETSIFVLQQLWPRLDLLLICVRSREEQQFMPQGDLIAPGEIWFPAESSLEVNLDDPDAVDWKRTIFSMRRYLKVEGGR